MGEYSYCFLLKKKEAVKSPILLRVRSKYMTTRLEMPVGESIEPSKFEKLNDSTKKMADLLGAFIRAFESYPAKEVRDTKKIKQLIISDLYPDRAKVEAAIMEQEEEAKKFNTSQFVRKAVSEKWKTKNYRKESIEPTTGTIKNWKSLANNLDWFKRDTGRSLKFEDINLDWLEHFVDWLRSPHEIVHNDQIRNSAGINSGTAWKYIKDLKKFLKIAQIRYKYQVDLCYTEFSISHGYDQEQTPLYLSKEELRTIKDLDLTEYPGLSKTREWLLIACLTGQRLSDWNEIRSENVVFENGMETIQLTQQKTKAKVKIPINPTIKEIWNKYPKGIPAPGADQKINKKLKTICQKAGIDTVLMAGINGEKVYKWEKISSHIGRRSFCTNAYLDKIPPLEIMVVSGHKTESEFLRYIRMSNEEKLQRIALNPFFTEAI